MTAPYGEIEGVPVEFTRHAIQRMLEMEITADEVRRLILNPEEVYDSKKYPGSVCHRRGRFSMAFRLDEGRGRYVVTTLLFATQREWLRADREGMLGDDRALRIEDMKCLPVK